MVALVTSFHAWYRASTHPDRIRGTWVSVVLAFVSLVLLGALGLATWVAVRPAPAKDAPLGLGDYNAVQQVRYGYRGVRLVSGIGGPPRAKAPPPCGDTRTNATNERAEPRRKDRAEIGQNDTSCA